MSKCQYCNKSNAPERWTQVCFALWHTQSITIRYEQTFTSICAKIYIYFSIRTFLFFYFFILHNYLLKIFTSNYLFYILYYLNSYFWFFVYLRERERDNEFEVSQRNDNKAKKGKLEFPIHVKLIWLIYDLLKQ